MPGERSAQAVVDKIRAVTAPPPAAGPSRRQQRAEVRRRQVGERLQRALAENDRPVLIDLAMSGALAELGESDRQDVLQVVRALSYDAITRAIATDDDEAILAAVDRTVFAEDDDLDLAFRDRVQLAGAREAWTERVRVAARERDGRASVELLANPPAEGVERLLEACPIREQGWRSARGLKRVLCKYGIDRAEAACGLALGFGARSYKPVERILALERDRAARDDVDVVPGVFNDDVRGPTYFH